MSANRTNSPRPQATERLQCGLTRAPGDVMPAVAADVAMLLEANRAMQAELRRLRAADPYDLLAAHLVSISGVLD